MKKPIIYLVSGAIAATGLAGAGIYNAAHKTVSLDIDGQTTEVSTFAGSVASLLEDNEIILADGDLVVPSLNSALSEDSEVVIRYQREVTVDRDGETETIQTTALDAEELLLGLASDDEDVSLVASRSRGQERVNIGLRLNSDGPVALLADGKNLILEAGHGEVEDILAAQNITLGDNDRVSIQTLPIGIASVAALEEDEKDAKKSAKAEEDVTTASDAATTRKALLGVSGVTDASKLAAALDGEAGDIVTLVVQRVNVEEVTKKKAVKHKSKTVEDPNRFEDLGKFVKTAGKNGKTATTYEVVTVDGVQESKKKINHETLSKPVTEVIVVGTKERPKVVVAPKPAATSASKPSSGSSSKPPASSGGSAPAGVWAALAQCESGGNPSIVSSNGLYHGLYQFSVATWRSVGGAGLPSQASVAEQTKRAQILQARSGWGQWPHCSSKLGLR